MSEVDETATPSEAPPPAEECSVCRDVFANSSTLLLDCGHYFHDDCAKQWYKTTVPCNCPLCRASFATKAYFSEDGIQQPESQEWKELVQEQKRRLEEQPDIDEFLCVPRPSPESRFAFLIIFRRLLSRNYSRSMLDVIL
jgi:hypothetical protein